MRREHPLSHYLFFILLIFYLTLLSLVILSDISKASSIEEARSQGLDLGSKYKTSAGSVITSQNKTSTPGYTTDNPEQTKYYDGADTKTDVLTKIKNTQEGDLMANKLPARPKVEISYNDAFLNQSRAIEGNPEDVVSMLTGTYGECKPIEHKETIHEIKTCDEYEETNCVDGLKNVTVSGAETAYNYPYIDQNISWRGGSGCSKYTTVTNINIKDPSVISGFKLATVGWDDVIRISINGNVIYQNGDPDWGSCERGRVFGDSPNRDLKSYLVSGDNQILLEVGISGAGFASARYELYYPKDRICQTVSNCNNIPSNCSFQSTKCLNVSEENICNYRQKIYNCSTTTVTSTANVQCGSNVYCLNGQCEKIENENNQDFAKSIAYLSSLNQAAHDNTASANNLRIFSGEAQQCEKDTVSYNNCCRDDGWGQSYTGAQCKEEEQRLMELQSKKLCHYVGSYCSKKIPVIGKCLKTAKAYCCFNSKISRVVVEQGRAQLGIDWGSGEAPECRGFTANELQSIKFDQIDLSEISADIANSIVTPNTEALQNKVKQSMKGYEKTE